MAKLTKEVEKAIIDAAREFNVPVDAMFAMAKQESNFNPTAKAKSSTALGLFQHLNSRKEPTWDNLVDRYGARFGITRETPRTDPRASALMGAALMSENARMLSSVGLPVNTETLYMTHFAGPRTAVRVFDAPANKPAKSVFPANQYQANSFMRGKTVGQVRDFFGNKMGKYAEQYAPANPSTMSKSGYGFSPLSISENGIDGKNVTRSTTRDQYGNVVAVPQTSKPSSKPGRLSDEYVRPAPLSPFPSGRVPVPQRAARELTITPNKVQTFTFNPNVPQFPAGAMLTGPAAIREREERGLYAAARGAPLSFDNRNLQVAAGIIDRAGSPTMAIPEGARKSGRVAVSKSEALAKQIAEYARNPTPQGLGALREAMNGSAYTTPDKATALRSAVQAINDQDSLAGALGKITGNTSVESRARQYTSELANINEVARLNQDIAKGFFDPGQQIFDKNVVTRPEFAAMGASMFPDAFAGLYGPDRRASGWGLMAPTERKMPELSKVNPSAIQRMQDNLTSKMAFAQPNPSNMNISGYGFSTPAQPAGPQAAGSATGSINRASAVGNLAVPGRSPGVLGGRGNINPPNVVAPPANVLSNFDQFGRFTGNQQSSKAPTSDFRSTLADRANVPQSLPQVATPSAPIQSMDDATRAAQAQTAKQMARDQFARDLIRSMPAPTPAALPQRAPAGTPGNMGAAGYGPALMDAIDIPGSGVRQAIPNAPAAPSVTRSLPNVPQTVAPQPQAVGTPQFPGNSWPSQQQAAEMYNQSIGRIGTVGPRSPNVAAPNIAPNAADEAAKQRFDAAKPGVFQGIPPQDIYDENAPGRSGFRGFGAGGFLGNLLTGNIGNMAGIEGGNRLPGLLGVLQNVVQGIRTPQQAQQAVQAVQTVAPALGQVMGLPAAQQAAQAGNNMVIGRGANGILGWMADGGLSAGAANAGWMSNNPERNFGGYGGGYDPTPV